MLETNALCCFIRLFVSLTFLSGLCESLKDIRVVVPSAIRKGETAVFLCDFDEENEQIYAVKWYKGRKEFYRYTPKDEYPIKTFRVPHILVDVNKSNQTQLTLLNVTPPLSGAYNCEVSAESPSFITVFASAEMVVVETPTRDPVIEIPKTSYRVSEKLDAVCIAGASWPKANISWFINGEKAHQDYVRALSPFEGPSGLIEARSQLSFVVKSYTFRDNKFDLRCTASLMNLYQTSVERRVDEARIVDPEIVVFVGHTEGSGTSGSGSPLRSPQTFAPFILFVAAFIS